MPRDRNDGGRAQKGGTAAVMKKKRLPVYLAALVTLGSGLINLFSVIGPSLPGRLAALKEVFPVEFITLSRFAVMILGFALVIASINILKRKKRAYSLTIALVILSIGFHLGKGIDYEEATALLVLLGVLAAARRQFTVKSGEPNVERTMIRLGTALAVAIGYGAAGFWFMDKRDFGIDFHIADAIKQTFRYLSFIGNPDLVPKTHHARWFLDSLPVMSTISILYVLWTLFRPVRYIFHQHPEELERAREIAARYGRHELDVFKVWPDKSLFFWRGAFLAYRVGVHTAVVLGDPVGPEEDIPGIIKEFRTVCDDNDWLLVFHQTLPDFLPVYESLGYQKVKIGDDAVVNLKAFSLEGKEGREHRYDMSKLEKKGARVEAFAPPVPDDVLHECRSVSNEWLKIGGHRERGFTLGSFDQKYVRGTRVVAAFDETGTMQAFLNVIHSPRKGEASVDLMRRRTDAPQGVMDYLFIKVLLMYQAEGYDRFTLGMAPMSGFRTGEDATQVEKLIHAFLQRLNFLFSFKGLYAFKAKYAQIWEPRYVILEHVTDLPRHAVALSAVSER
jgi:phosphatidylglycerol lysyltransferase